MHGWRFLVSPERKNKMNKCNRNSVTDKAKSKDRSLEDVLQQLDELEANILLTIEEAKANWAAYQAMGGWCGTEVDHG
jgi:hypothetical protein